MASDDNSPQPSSSEVSQWVQEQTSTEEFRRSLGDEAVREYRAQTKATYKQSDPSEYADFEAVVGLPLNLQRVSFRELCQTTLDAYNREQGVALSLEVPRVRHFIQELVAHQILIFHTDYLDLIERAEELELSQQAVHVVGLKAIADISEAHPGLQKAITNVFSQGVPPEDVDLTRAIPPASEADYDASTLTRNMIVTPRRKSQRVTVDPDSPEEIEYRRKEAERRANRR